MLFLLIIVFEIPNINYLQLNAQNVVLTLLGLPEIILQVLFVYTIKLIKILSIPTANNLFIH